MTMTTASTTGDVLEPRPDLVTVTIDGVETAVPKGTLIIRAAEQLGVAVPRFCDHPLLDPVANCRMCLIEVEGMPKPQPACAVTCSDGMVVKTQMTSPVADEAQRSVMEFLLINHPLDCPICDKGGECPLQNQAMTNGQGDTRFDGPKRTFPKPINLSAQVLLDRERCVSCARCTRFAEQIAGDPFIELLERGSQQQVGIAEDVPFNSYYSGNTIQICPVGALTSAMYRFRSRPFDLVSTPTACEHCASGCSLRTDSRRNAVMRRLASVDPEVNEEWNCDKGRFAFRYLESDVRLTTPMVRVDGELRPASWDEALVTAAAGLKAAAGKAGIITGGRLMVEDAYAYSVFARRALGTNDIDFRPQGSSAEEEQFLASRVAGAGLGPTYADLEKAPTVLLVAFEPEDESPIVLLRLRKAAKTGTQILSVAPAASRGLAKTNGTWIPAAPGAEPTVIAGLDENTVTALSQPGSVILVGQRAAVTAGLLSAVGRLADRTGAALGWVPRRAGDRGAVEAGVLPSLLPGGRPVADAAARVDTAAIWGVPEVPEAPGRDIPAMLAAIEGRELSALVVGGVRLDDLPADAEAALRATEFLVVLDTHAHGLVELANVVFPVAAAPEKAGTFINWEGRQRPSSQALRTNLMSDARVLAALAGELGVVGLDGDLARLRAQLGEFSGWEGVRVGSPDVAAATGEPGPGLLLATWRPLLEATVLQEGEPYLAATARGREVWLSAPESAALGATEGQLITVTSASGSVTAPLVVAETAEGTVVVTGDAHRVLGQSGERVQIAVEGQG
ncbi:MAG: NADH-quinone oxidoreductase subunit G [Actinomycetia bacterium]|nr:NADH-quinone oxidoreductase subunit G [Actinomycetes bacterium]